MADNKSVPSIVLGTMTFGKQVNEKTADRIVGVFLEKGHTEIDTAHNYTDGLSEEILGRILTPSRRAKTYLATKMNPWKGGGLGPQELTKQLELSLKRLRTGCVDLLYLHAPDPQTPIELTLDCCEKLYRQGKFKHLGLSNYASWQVINIWHLAGRKEWSAPLVYQGMYNAITRDVERELFPALWTAAMRFYAYNPLAGGLLTGKHMDPDTKPSAGRFVLSPTYMGRYWRENYFKALDTIRHVCAERAISMAESALRWIRYHSFLKGENRDGIILGASSLEQFENNLKSCEERELSREIILAFDEAWDIARPECPKYFRS